VLGRVDAEGTWLCPAGLGNTEGSTELSVTSVDMPYTSGPKTKRRAGKPTSERHWAQVRPVPVKRYVNLLS
jgi:hypothetical protein